MLKSVITIDNWYFDKSEMLIPICIGEAREGYCHTRRMDRMLPQGHRLRGYEE